MKRQFLILACLAVSLFAAGVSENSPPSFSKDVGNYSEPKITQMEFAKPEVVFTISRLEELPSLNPIVTIFPTEEANQVPAKGICVHAQKYGYMPWVMNTALSYRWELKNIVNKKSELPTQARYLYNNRATFILYRA